MLEFIIRLLKRFLDSISGKDRRELQRLTQRLRAERAEFDDFGKEQARLRQEHAQLRQDHQAVITERDRLQSECDRLQLERDHLQSEYDCLQLERDRFIRQHEQSGAEQIQLQQAYNKLEQDRASWAIERQALEEKHAILTQEKQTVFLELEQLRSTVERLKKNNNDLAEMAQADDQQCKQQLSKERRHIAQLLHEKTSLEAKLKRCIYEHSEEINPDKLGANQDQSLFGTREPNSWDNLDLSSVSIAIVGGHDHLRHHVVEKLKNEHGVRKNNIRELSADHSSDHGSVKEKIQHCDFIFIVTESISHRLSNSVMDLRNRNSLGGEVIRLDKSGVTSVISMILSHIADQMEW